MKLRILCAAYQAALGYDYCPDEDDIQMITDDPDELKVIERLELEHGINPFWYPTGDFEFVNEAYEVYKLQKFHETYPYNLKNDLWV